MTCQALAGGADLIFIDGAVANVAITQVASAARSLTKPPFLVLLAAQGATVGSFATDAVAEKPAWPAGVKRLIIWGDNDASMTGQVAAYALAKKIIARGILAEVRIPPQVGTDWLDVLTGSVQG